MGLGVSLRYVRTIDEKTTARIVAKAGVTGIELEVGATRRVSQFSNAGMAVSYGYTVRNSCPRPF